MIDVRGGMMYAKSPKKLIIINILDILKRYTDENHRLSQKDIQDILNANMIWRLSARRSSAIWWTWSSSAITSTISDMITASIISAIKTDIRMGRTVRKISYAHFFDFWVYFFLTFLRNYCIKKDYFWLNWCRIKEEEIWIKTK